MSNKMLPSGISVRIREDLIDGVSRTQTTLIIDPIITQGGHRVTMDDIGSIGYGKIDGGGPREEIISWTGITDNITTYTLTGCVWGVNFHNLEADADNTRRHTSGAKFEIKTDMHYITNQFRDNEDNVFTNTDPMEFNSNEIKLGDGTDTLDKVITADNGDANEPFVKYNETTGKWEISNDGVNSYDPEDGGSGVTAGDAILIDAGSINVKTKETSGVHITGDEVAIEYQTNPGLDIVDNKLGVKVKSGTGLLKDADGIYNDSIDPDNISPQSVGYLTGGTGHSALAVFQSLGAGANDGKFKINVDGTEYDDVGVAIPYSNFNNDIQHTTGTIAQRYCGGIEWFGQSFTTTSNAGFLDKIRLRLKKNALFSGDFTIYLYNASGDTPTGSAIKTVSIPISSLTTSVATYEFQFNVKLEKSTKYVLVFSAIGGSTYKKAVIECDGYDGYSGGSSIISNNSGETWSYYSGDLWFQMDMINVLESINELSTLIQSSIRLRTGSTETVVYDTDHFVITSSIVGRQSQILKLMSPSTGTDISGAGATPYLDMADNATETQGTGEEYRLVRLDGDGKMLQSLYRTGGDEVTTGRELSTIYQNTSSGPIFVVASIAMSGQYGQNATVEARIGASSTPSTVIAKVARSTTSGATGIGSATIPMSFIVPAGYYYRVIRTDASTSTVSLDSWFECDLI